MGIHNGYACDDTLHLPSQVQKGQVRPEWMTITQGFLCGLIPNGTKREGIRVYCYHGLVENKADALLERNFHLLSDFKRHVQFLHRFRILNLVELAEEVCRPTKHSKPAAVITFDDGFANNLMAAEMLAAFRLPWAVFVSTGAVGRGGIIWTVELSLLLLHGQAEKLEAIGREWWLGHRKSREVAFQAIRVPMKSMPSELRKKTMNLIRQQFPEEETQRLLSEFHSVRMLAWEEIEQLAAMSVDIGSHGVHHENHHANQPEVVRLRELADSKAELEVRLKRPCQFFAFPNGDYNLFSPAEVRAAGYHLGFTTRPGTVTQGANPYLLPRIEPAARIFRYVREFLRESKRQRQRAAACLNDEGLS